MLDEEDFGVKVLGQLRRKGDWGAVADAVAAGGDPDGRGEDHEFS